MYQRLWVEETSRCPGAFLCRYFFGLEAVETLLRPRPSGLHGLQCFRPTDSSHCNVARGLRVVQNSLSWAQLFPKSHPIRSPPEDHHCGCSGIAKPRTLAGDVVNEISLDTWPSLDWKLWDLGVELLWSETQKRTLRLCMYVCKYVCLILHSSLRNLERHELVLPTGDQKTRTFLNSLACECECRMPDDH